MCEAGAAFGLIVEPDLVLDDEFALWPENESTFDLWLAVQSQWDVSPAGVRYRLNYPGVRVVFEMRGMNKREQRRQFPLLQVMENACIAEWARNRK